MLDWIADGHPHSVFDVGTDSIETAIVIWIIVCLIVIIFGFLALCLIRKIMLSEKSIAELTKIAAENEPKRYKYVFDGKHLLQHRPDPLSPPLTDPITCSGPLLLTLPDTYPDGFDILIIRNASIRSITKHAFRKFENAREIRIEDCGQLDTLEKFAFKGLKKLRHATNIRELSISGSDLALSRHSFASITQLDFLTLSGVTLIEPQLFTNSSRFYIIHIKESHFEIPPNAFDDLSHVHQLLIQRSRLSTIAPSAFSGISTVETIELFNNTIGTLSARAFSAVTNLGRLRIARNNIKHLDTAESILSMAIQSKIEENSLEYHCDMKWMTAHQDRRLVDVNYCGATGVYRSIRSFIKQNCETTHTARSVSAPETYRQPNIQQTSFLKVTWYLFCCGIVVIYSCPINIGFIFCFL